MKRNAIFYALIAVFATACGGGNDNHIDYKPEQNPGQQPGNNQGQQLGNNQGHQPGNKPEYQPGSNQGQQPGSNTGQQPGSNQGQQPGNNQGQQPGNNQGQQPGNNQGQQPGDNIVINKYEIEPFSDKEKMEIQIALSKVNELRIKAGANLLTLDDSLSAYAKLRAKEIVSKFSHQRPNGEQPWSEVTNYRYVGENIAAGSESGEDVVMKQWKPSQGHYENMININYDKLGMAVIYVPNSEYKYYWVQIFSTKNAYTSYIFKNKNSNVAGINFSIDDMYSELSDNIIFDNTGRINLLPSNVNPSDDIAVRAYEQKIINDRSFATAVIYPYGSYKLILREPTQSGWQYQTFGEVQNEKNNPISYVSFGQAVDLPVNKTIYANYNGVGKAYHENYGHVVSDFNAQLAVDNSAQNLTINIDNSKVLIENGSQLTANANKELDFTQQLNWNANAKKFSDNQGNEASLYGSNLDEVGGTFQRDNGRYIGAFGGVKTTP